MNRFGLVALTVGSVCLGTSAAPPSCPAQDVAIPFNDVVLGEDHEEIPAGYAAASAALGGLNLTTSYLNLTPRATGESPSWARYAGVFGGLAGIGLGGAMLVQDKYDGETALGVSNIVVGAVSTFVGFSSLIRAKNADVTGSVPYDPKHVTIAAAFHGGMAPGVGLRLRF